MVLLFSKQYRTRLIILTFFYCFAAPVYENEQQTAIESYDGGELEHKFHDFVFLFFRAPITFRFSPESNNVFFSLQIYRSPFAIFFFFVQRMAATTTITTTEKVTE